MERRLTALIAATIAMMALAVLWSVFVRHRVPAESTVTPPVTAAPDTTPPPASPPAPPAGTTTASQGVGPDTGGLSYMDALARSETRRRIRASAGVTYLNEIVAASQDSMLHRWDNRARHPVRVYVTPGTVANFQPAFVDAIRDAFAEWGRSGVPVSFDLGGDSTNAEVTFRWRIQFEIERTGQTDLEWDQDGHILKATVTIASFDPKGRPLGADDVRAVALHEIGHVLGLDHSPDSTDLMYAKGTIRRLSDKDVRTALLLPAGYVAALQCDPTEKKPFFHCLPGSDTLTFGMLGCDFHCGYCQNWLTSQALRDDTAGVLPTDVTPDDLVRLARRQGARMVGSSYNEPLITAEWAVEVFREARASGLKTAFISNGNATPEVLDYIRPWTDCYKIDLKAMDDRRYRELGGVLQHVLDAIRLVYERGFWLEIVTLIVPGFNDDDAQLTRAAEYIVAVSPEIPWHVTAFHKDYKMTDPDDTPAATLVRACEIGARAGLRFVYAGNLPGRVGRWEHTYCPDCGDLLIERSGYAIKQQRIGPDGRCPSCHRRIPGVWS